MNRAIWVAVGLVLAVMLTIVWSLTRFHVTSAEHAHSAAPDEQQRAEDNSELEASPDRAVALPIAGQSARQVETDRTFADVKSTDPAESPARGITVHGFVTDARGGQVRMDELLRDQQANHLASIERQVLLFGKSTRPRETSFGEDGSYSLAGLASGEWTVSAEASGYRTSRDRITLLEGEQDRRLDIALEPYDILHVRIEIELDEPIGNAQSLAQLAHDSERIGTIRVVVSRTSASGILDEEREIDSAARLSGELATREEREGPLTWTIRKSIELMAAPPLFASVAVGNRVLESKPLLSTDPEVVFSFTMAQIRSSLGSVRFRLVDDKGHAPDGSPRIELARNFPSLSGSRELSEVDPATGIRCYSSEAGETEVTGLHGGPVGIEIKQLGFARLRVETVIEPGVERDLGEFRLQRERAIRGHVVNRDGTPAYADVNCSALRLASEGPGMFQPQVSSTDSPGHFVFYDVSPGRYVLQACRGGRPCSCSQVVSTEAGPVDGIVIEIQEPTSVTFKLERPPKDPVTLQIEDPQGLFVATLPMQSTGSGAFTGLDLVRGSYTARAFANDRELAKVDFVVRDTPLRVVLSPP